MPRATPTSETAEVRRAVARYLAYGALALVLVSLPTFYALGRIAEQHALDGAAVDGASIARRLLAPAVTDGAPGRRPHRHRRDGPAARAADE